MLTFSLITMILLSFNTQASFFPIEAILSDENNYSTKIDIKNNTNNKMLYEIVLINRSPNKNNILKRNIKWHESEINKNQLQITPRQFIADGLSFQKVFISINKEYVDKLEDGTYLMGLTVRSLGKIDSLKSNTKVPKLIKAGAEIVPTILTNIILIKNKKPSKIKLNKFSIKQDKLELMFERLNNYFGFGYLTISESLDKKDWNNIYEKEYKLYNKKGNISINLKNKKKFYKVKYQMLSRYGKHTYFEKIIKI